jgi:hypothetical protein
MTYLFYSNNADPSDSWSNHISNAPVIMCECGSNNGFTTKRKVYDFLKNKQVIKTFWVCRDCWRKREI